MNAPFMVKDKIASLVKRAKRIRGANEVWMNKFEELAHYFHSARQGFVTTIPEGSDLLEDIWDSEPEKVRRKFSEAFVGAMCPRDKKWLAIVPEDESLSSIPEVVLWCQDASNRMLTVIKDRDVNFFERIMEASDDVTSFGTSIVYIDHNIKKRILSMCVEHIKDFVFEIDVNGTITAQYKFINMLLSDIVSMFGEGSLPDSLLQSWRDVRSDSHEKEYPVIHMIIKNDMYERYGLNPGSLPLKSLWVLDVDNHVLNGDDGYYEFPYVVTYWYRKSRELWGRSDAEWALPDARLLQSVSSALLEITEKQGNPPMMGPADVLRGEIELFPGGYTAVENGFQYQGDPIKPIQIGSNPAMTADYLALLEKKIGDAFHGDVLSPSAPKNADEMYAAQQNMAIRLGPIFSRAENEFIPPILDRIFSIMYRANAFAPVPEVLRGKKLIYKFDNHISEMMAIAEAQKDAQGVGMVLQFQRPESVENIDWDAFTRGTLAKIRIPIQYLKPIEVVVEERKQRQQMEQMMMMAEAANKAGPGLKGGADALKSAQESGVDLNGGQ